MYIIHNKLNLLKTLSSNSPITSNSNHKFALTIYVIIFCWSDSYDKGACLQRYSSETLYVF